jgi:HSP20 family protein
MGQAYKLKEDEAMTLIRRNGSLWPDLSPFKLLTDNFFNNNWLNFWITGSTAPAVNIVETEDDFQLEVAAPGMRRKDFHVTLDNDMLTISSEKKDEAQDEAYSHREFSYASFERKFYLPNTVEADQIKAKYQDGILRLVIPKKEEAKRKPARQIAIS